MEEPAAEGSNEKGRNSKTHLLEHTACRGHIHEMFFISLPGSSSGGEPSAEACFEDDLYLKVPVMDRRKGDPLHWWRQNEWCFKLLAPLGQF